MFYSPFSAAVANVFNKTQKDIDKKLFENPESVSHPEFSAKNSLIYLPTQQHHMTHLILVKPFLFLKIQSGRTNSGFPKTF